MSSGTIPDSKRDAYYYGKHIGQIYLLNMGYGKAYVMTEHGKRVRILQGII